MNPKTRSAPVELMTGFLPFFVLGAMAFWIVEFRSSILELCDFRQLYVSGFMIRSGLGSQLYSYRHQFELQNLLVSQNWVALPFIRPAYAALLFAPFSYLPYRQAYLLWAICNVGLVVLTCWLSFRFIPQYHWAPLPIILFLLFAPFSIAIVQGQDSIAWFALFIAAGIMLTRGKDEFAGALLAIGLFKFQLSIPIALVMLIWRKWKFSAGFLATSITLLLLSLALIGQDGIVDLIHRRFAQPSPRYFYERMANVHSILVGLWGSSQGTAIAGALLSLTILILLGMVAKRRDIFSAAVIAGPCAFYLSSHDWIFLIMPILITLRSGAVAWIALITYLAANASPLYWGYCWLFAIPMIALAFIFATSTAAVDNKLGEYH